MSIVYAPHETTNKTGVIQCHGGLQLSAELALV
jgi:hypothetical protein